VSYVSLHEQYWRHSRSAARCRGHWSNLIGKTTDLVFVDCYFADSMATLGSLSGSEKSFPIHLLMRGRGDRVRGPGFMSVIRVIVLRLRRDRGGGQLLPIALNSSPFRHVKPRGKVRWWNTVLSAPEIKTVVPISGNDREQFSLLAVRLLRTQRTTTNGFPHHCVETGCSHAHHYALRVVSLR
jgi:hypothetical protein